MRLTLEYKFIIVIILFIQVYANAQKSDDSLYLAPFIRNHKYLNYLCSPTPESQASLIYYGVEYLYVPRNSSFFTSGTHLNFGFNIARLFTRKFIFGICYERKSFSSLTLPRFSSEFISDFNSNYIPQYNDDKDSLRGYVFKKCINSESGNGVNGNIYSAIGICFSPFPQKYGGFIIGVKRGNRLYPFYGPDIDKIREDSGVYLTLRKCYSVELRFKPFILFSSSEKIFFYQKRKSFYKWFVVSFFYEKLTLNNATFNSVPLNQLVNQNFIDKYSNINNFGINLGFMLY